MSKTPLCVRCPRCASDAIMVREVVGWRRNLLECLDCGWRWLT